MARLVDITGSNLMGFLTGPEPSTLEGRVQTKELGGTGYMVEEAVALRGKALEPSTWAGRASHLTALCRYLKPKNRELP